MRLFTLFLFLSLPVAFATKAPTDDAELTRKLVGTWVTDPAEKSQFVSTTTYNADGTGTESVRLRDQPENTSVIVKTRWSVKDGILSLKSVASSDPQRIPVGLELKDRIISLSEERFVFEASEGYGEAKGKQGVKVKKKSANNRVERTAAVRFGFDGDELQTAVVAVASALPAAVAHPCR